MVLMTSLLGHESSDMPVTNFELQVFDPDYYQKPDWGFLSPFPRKKIKIDFRVIKNGPNDYGSLFQEFDFWRNSK